MTITKRKNKSGSYSYRIKVSLGYDHNGKQIVKSTTYVPPKGMPAKQAEREANKFGIIFEEKCERDRSFTDKIRFRVLADEWITLMEHTKELKPSTLTRLKGLRERTYQFLGDVYVCEISYKMIQDFVISLTNDNVNQRTGKGLSQKTQKHYISFVSDVFRYALKCNLISFNPCKDISTIKTEIKIVQPYTLDEVRDILKRIDEKAPIKYKVFFNLLPYTGARRGEILGLEFGDIDFNTGVVDICRTSNYQPNEGIYTSSTKTIASERCLYFPPELLDMIKTLKYVQRTFKTDRLFISSKGKPMHPNTPYTWLQRFCERERLPFKGLHAFRHFFATQAFYNGVNIKDVSAMLGHAQTSTTMDIYAHAIEKVNKNAFKSVADAINH